MEPCIPEVHQESLRIPGFELADIKLALVVPQVVCKLILANASASLLIRAGLRPVGLSPSRVCHQSRKATC
eukprot:13698553-Alexandrium_andersonii.AAC.1